MSLNIPFLLMMVLTMIIWFFMGRLRLRALKARDVSIKAFKTRTAAAELPENIQKVADNFKNQFELPVIFYALCLYLAWGNEVSVTYIALAYVFVISRYVHSWIHCTYNNVVHRFYAYLVGGVALWLMVIMTIWGVLFY